MRVWLSLQTGLFVCFDLFKCDFTSTHLYMDLDFNWTIHFSDFHWCAEVVCPAMILHYGVSSGYLHPLACLPGSVCGEGTVVGVPASPTGVFCYYYGGLHCRVFPLALWGLQYSPSGSVSSSVPICLLGSWSLHSFGLCAQ